MDSPAFGTASKQPRIGDRRFGTSGSRAGGYASYDCGVLAEVISSAALICLDPGHGTPPVIGRQREPIGPGSAVTKIKDPGGAPGEAGVVLSIARKTRVLLLRRGYRVAMTRDGPTFRGGNIARARFCNRRHAALMLRIHADGSENVALRGIHTLAPAYHRGWTDDVYRKSRRAARAVQRAIIFATGARNLGVVERSDLTGFNWANVPVVLVETGFLTNSVERRLLHSSGYQWRVARGLAAGAESFTRRAPDSSARGRIVPRHEPLAGARPGLRGPRRRDRLASPHPRTPLDPRRPDDHRPAVAAVPPRADPRARVRPIPPGGV
jgi:N-acetylmuramoyl-L-alanine amidase